MDVLSSGFADTCRLCACVILRKSRSKPRICGVCERMRHEPIADQCKDCGLDIIRCNIRKSRLCSRCKKVREREARFRTMECPNSPGDGSRRGAVGANTRPVGRRGPLVRVGYRTPATGRASEMSPTAAFRAGGAASSSPGLLSRSLATPLMALAGNPWQYTPPPHPYTPGQFMTYGEAKPFGMIFDVVGTPLAADDGRVREAAMGVPAAVALHTVSHSREVRSKGHEQRGAKHPRLSQSKPRTQADAQMVAVKTESIDSDCFPPPPRLFNGQDPDDGRADWATVFSLCSNPGHGHKKHEAELPLALNFDAAFAHSDWGAEDFFFAVPTRPPSDDHADPVRVGQF
eukprot:Polyplicarium_translucidae@DN3926_c0_g1_i1.p1